MKQFVAFLIRLIPWLSADYRRRIKPKRKCLACGAVKTHRMKFDPTQQVVVITCICCEASWGYEPVTKTQKWLKPPTEG